MARNGYQIQRAGLVSKREHTDTRFAPYQPRGESIGCVWVFCMAGLAIASQRLS